MVVYWHPNSYFTGRWEAMAAGVGYLLRKHPELRRSRRGHAWIEGQQAFAYAAAGARDRQPLYRTATIRVRLCAVEQAQDRVGAAGIAGRSFRCPALVC